MSDTPNAAPHTAADDPPAAGSDALAAGSDAPAAATATPHPDGTSVTGERLTGVAAADDARERLDAVEHAPWDEHVAIYEDVHRRLQEGLADLDDR